MGGVAGCILPDLSFFLPEDSQSHLIVAVPLPFQCCEVSIETFIGTSIETYPKRS